MRTFTDLIDTWPSIVQFAQDVGIGYEAARAMRSRNNIKHEHWQSVIDAAHSRGIALTADDLLRMSRTRQTRRREKVNRSGARAAA